MGIISCVVMVVHVYCMVGDAWTCVACGNLADHPEVQLFMGEDIELFHNVRFRHVPQKLPEMVLYNRFHEVLQRIPLKTLSHEEINELLLTKGFYKKETSDDEVPEEYEDAPYSSKVKVIRIKNKEAPNTKEKEEL